jgi:hypothetical protein
LAIANKEQDLNCETTGYFGRNWGGKLSARNQSEEAEKAERRTRYACEAYSAQRALATIIESSFPAFWTPLYIGVAKNLQRRLSKHQADYKTRHHSHSDIPNTTHISSDDDDSIILAKRLHSCGYTPDQLMILIIPIEFSIEDTPLDTVREIAEVAEYWLNRFNSPRLGRL